MTHLKRLNTPKTWQLWKKERVFITKPNPGPHSLDTCMSINLLIKTLLKFAKTTREVKKLLNEGKILIDGIARKNHKFPVGLMDIIEVPDLQLQYVFLFNENGKLIHKQINKEDTKIKTCKIVNKKILRGKKIQLNLYDGNNIIVDKDAYKVGDSIVVSVPKKEIKNHLKLEKGALIYLIGGKHIGRFGILDEIKQFKSTEEDRIIIKSKNENIETLKSYAFVVNKQF